VYAVSGEMKEKQKDSGPNERSESAMSQLPNLEALRDQISKLHETLRRLLEKALRRDRHAGFDFSFDKSDSGVRPLEFRA
jgi:hypothetical protein